MSDLTQEEKLIALGLKNPSSKSNPYSSLFTQLKDATTWTSFRDDVQNNQTSFADFESYLTGTIGMSSSDAAKFRSWTEQRYQTNGSPDFSKFQSDLDNYGSFDEWEASFRFGTSLTGSTSDGSGPNAGVRIHSEPGVSFDNVKVPAGTVEVFGPRVEFSETGSSVSSTPSFSLSNFYVSNTTPNRYEEITISVDVTNNGSYFEYYTATLTEDGDAVDSENKRINAGATVTFTFKRTYTELQSIDVKINTAGPKTISVIPEQLV